MTAWRTWSRSQVACRLLVALLPVVALLVAPVRPSAAVLAIVMAGSVLWAVSPELAAGPAVLLFVMAWWASAVPDPVRPSILVAAAALLSAHVAGLLAAYAPARGRIHPQLVRTWAGRALLAFLPAPVVLLALVALDGGPEQSVTWPLALAALALLTLVVALFLREGPARLSPQAGGKSVENDLSDVENRGQVGRTRGSTRIDRN